MRKYDADKIDSIIQKHIDNEFNMAKMHMKDDVLRSYNHLERSKMLRLLLLEVRQKILVEENSMH